jgi:hypothetical protein
MKNYIVRGHLEPNWSDSYKQFEYVRQPIKDSEIANWRSMGYTHDTFSGVMYGGKNPMPDWVYTVADRLMLKNPGFVFYKMSCMEVMPPHEDHFETYCKVFNVERQDVYRGLVMLEDWKPGHYLEMLGKAYTEWTAGDYFVWSADVEHAASNIGSEPRWTLQITGTLDGTR